MQYIRKQGRFMRSLQTWSKQWRWLPMICEGRVGLCAATFELNNVALQSWDCDVMFLGPAFRLERGSSVLGFRNVRFAKVLVKTVAGILFGALRSRSRPVEIAASSSFPFLEE